MALKNSILPTLPNCFLVFFILHKWHRHPSNCSSPKPKSYWWFLHLHLPHLIHYQVLFILAIKYSLNLSAFSLSLLPPPPPLSLAPAKPFICTFPCFFLPHLTIHSPASSQHNFWKLDAIQCTYNVHFYKLSCVYSCETIPVIKVLCPLFQKVSLCPLVIDSSPPHLPSHQSSCNPRSALRHYGLLCIF